MNFMTLTGYAPREGWNAYTYECDAGTCDSEASRTVVEVPVPLDEFAVKGCPRTAVRRFRPLAARLVPATCLPRNLYPASHVLTGGGTP
jgi:hypothetical protein